MGALCRQHLDCTGISSSGHQCWGRCVSLCLKKNQLLWTTRLYLSAKGFPACKMIDRRKHCLSATSYSDVALSRCLCAGYPGRKISLIDFGQYNQPLGPRGWLMPATKREPSPFVSDQGSGLSVDIHHRWVGGGSPEQGSSQH